MKRTTKREGFTLVELLIVIVVIGILSAMMMLSSTEAVSSAKASNIVSNLRNLKTAALAYYTDNMDTIDAAPTTYAIGDHMDEIWKYMNNQTTAENKTTNNAADAANYKIVVGTGNALGMWFLTYDINEKTGSSSEQTRIKEKLKGRAKSVGLVNGAADNTYTAAYDASANTVYYFVR